MQKIVYSSIVLVTLCYSNLIFSSSKPTNPEPNWTGFYLGANTGYWGSQNNDIVSTGSSSFINPAFPSGAGSITTALAQMATNHFSLQSSGFTGGGQVGYNQQYNKRVLVGLDIDFNGLINSNDTYTLQKSVNLVDFDESYIGSLVVKQKINYLGTVRARLGYLCHPTFLVYATGGFAYGNVTLDTAWAAQESLGATVFPAISSQNNLNKTLTGWTAGGGIEWLFKPNWSAKLEYTYYGLNDLTAPVILAQMNESVTPSALWGSTAVNTALSVSVGTIRFGINYHFS